MQDCIVIVAGGVGSRMGTALPKQFLEVGGRPVILRTIDAFLNYNPGIKVIVALNALASDLWDAMKSKYRVPDGIVLVEGGKERFHSVKNALQEVDTDQGVVGVHDAVRPFVSIACIENCFNTARQLGNAVPVVMVEESLRKVDGDGSKPADRQVFRLVQTPQCFDVKLLKDAYEQEFNFGFTDDASVVEKLGIRINLIEGNKENIKLTSPEDLILAEALALRF